MSAKAMIVFGTRPEAIKMCPVVKALEAVEGLEAVTCVTGQHREMLDSVLDIFRVSPRYDLKIMRPNQSLFDISSETMAGIRGPLIEERPDIVLVHGDTTTSFAAALATFYLGIPIGHVEAGLRTHNMFSPWPEEFNRQAVDLVTSLYFAPTDAARKNLLKEGKNPEAIYVTGNTGIDSLRFTVNENYQDDNLQWARDGRLILMTAHRRENLGYPMRGMFRAIRRAVEEHPDLRVIYPVHPNPQVQKAAHEVFEGVQAIRLIDPLDVVAFHNYLAASYLVLTDSGGVQEEAPSLGKPVLVMRDTTERPEGVEAGTLQVVGTDERSVYEAFIRLIEDNCAYRSMSRASNPYGDGHASERIASILADRLVDQGVGSHQDSMTNALAGKA